MSTARLQTSVVRLAYYDGKEWQSRDYSTDDGQWRIAFTIIKNTFDRVKLIYL